MSLKRKSTANDLAQPTENKRRTRSSGKPEITVLLWPDDLEHQPHPKEDADQTAQTREKYGFARSENAITIDTSEEDQLVSDTGSVQEIDGFIRPLPTPPPFLRPPPSFPRDSETVSSSPSRSSSPSKGRRSTFNHSRPRRNQVLSSPSPTPSSRPEGPFSDLDEIQASNIIRFKGKGRAFVEEDEEDESVIEVEQNPIVQRRQPRATRGLDSRFNDLLEAQKITMLRKLSRPSISNGFTNAQNTVAMESLVSVLRGSTERGEGNSCLVVGPRGSGKSAIIEEAIASISSGEMSPIVIRLSAEAQHNDKLAMREMARQLVRQTGASYTLPVEDETGASTSMPVSAEMIPPTHLPSLISTLVTLPRPTIVVLDAFDLFALHPRQALLYCLLDTVQACHAHSNRAGGRGTTASGIAVIGVTTRIDCLNSLEKRVKSRFSGRVIRVSHVNDFDGYLTMARCLLQKPPTEEGRTTGSRDRALSEELDVLWDDGVEAFLQDREVIRLLKDVYYLRKEIATLQRLLIPVVLNMSHEPPILRPRVLEDAFSSQIAPSSYHFLQELSYPHLALLVASYHVSNTGHDMFNFEMLWSNFSRQVDRTGSMPVTLDGASVGMIKVSRDVMLGAFERMIDLRVFQPPGPLPTNIAKTFVKYRCGVDRSDIMDAMDRSGNLKLKTWLKRSGE
ncbi:hypothetical protein FRB99_001864 [Tulasnella sp. 403]|nr:hypothetical protein FRB99_001864 [Tulasnella sp. 403]